MAGKLTLVPTPLGNLRDITERARQALEQADVVYAEDTRVTGRLLSALGVKARLERLDEQMMGLRAPLVASRVLAGEQAAYCTDAGMPGVSDPGLRLVRAAQDAGAPVEVLPGPSAAATAYVASGTTCPRYYFGGFFPRRRAEQRAALEGLRGLDAALVFYESPKRLVAALEAIAEALPCRQVAVCRELTKVHEEVARGSAAELAEGFRRREAEEGSVKGEVVIVIDAPVPEEALAAGAEAEDRARDLARQLAAEGLRTREVAQRLAAECGVPRNRAYDLAMEAQGR